MYPQTTRKRRRKNESSTDSANDCSVDRQCTASHGTGQDAAAEARAWAKRLTFSTGNPFHPKRNPRKEKTVMSNAGVAAILSLVVPGVGQIYNGDFLRGAVWLIAVPGFYFTTAGVVGGACHLVSAYTAYHRAKVKEQAASSKGASDESVITECISPCPAR
jgi:hypothetical protein